MLKSSRKRISLDFNVSHCMLALICSREHTQCESDRHCKNWDDASPFSL